MEQNIKDFQAFQEFYTSKITQLHLRQLLADSSRNSALKICQPGLIFDFAHQKITEEVLTWFESIHKSANLDSKIEAMFNGDKINPMNNWSVLHTALRAPASEPLVLPDQNVPKKSN